MKKSTYALVIFYDHATFEWNQKPNRVYKMVKKKEREIVQQWQPCSPGALTRLTDMAQTERRRDFLIKASTGSILVLGGFLGISQQMKKRPKEADAPSPRFISCRDVQNFMDDYIQQAITDPQLLANISQHLQLCGHCMQGFRNKNGNQV